MGTRIEYVIPLDEDENGTITVIVDSEHVLTSCIPDLIVTRLTDALGAELMDDAYECALESVGRYVPPPDPPPLPPFVDDYPKKQENPVGPVLFPRPLTIPEAADIAGMTENALRQLRHKGRGPAFRKRDGRLLIFEDDLRQWLNGEPA
jgi:hypothetical protein